MTGPSLTPDGYSTIRIPVLSDTTGPCDSWASVQPSPKAQTTSPLSSLMAVSIRLEETNGA
jgi:hypothetical protein